MHSGHKKKTVSQFRYRRSFSHVSASELKNYSSMFIKGVDVCLIAKRRGHLVSQSGSFLLD